MLIGIDASRSISTIQKTGVEKVSDELLKSILFLVETRHWRVSTNIGVDFIFYTPQQIDWLPQENQRILRWPFKFFWTQIRLAWELIFHQPDVMFFPAHSMPFFLLLIRVCRDAIYGVSKKKDAINRVSTKYYRIIHDIAFKKHPKLYSLKQRLILNLDLWLSLKLCNKIFVPSEAVKNDIIYFYRSSVSFCHSRRPRPALQRYGQSGNPINSLINKIIVTSWGYKKVNNELRIMNYGERKKQFLYIGRVEEKKNINNLTKAFKIFHKQYPEYKLILAGKVDKNFITHYSLPVTHYIELLGYISDEKKYELLKESTALIHIPFEEGFCFPMLEAFDFGLPIIASNIPVLKEIGGDACLCVNPNSIDSIANTMIKLVETHCHVSLQEIGYTRLKNFSWSKTAEKILNEIVK